MTEDVQMWLPAPPIPTKQEHCIHGDTVNRPECDGCELTRLRRDVEDVPALREGLRVYRQESIMAIGDSNAEFERACRAREAWAKANSLLLESL